jgi:hypothetical protein
MIKGRISLGLLLAIVLSGLLAFSSPVSAKKKTRSKARAHPKYFVLDVSLGVTYDDNIIRYSDPDLDIFASDTLSSKFAIESKQDWIIMPRIRPRLQGALIGNRPAWLILGYDYYGYAKNDVRRYSRFSVEARQYFSSKGYAQLSFSYIPDYYYRNLFIGTDSIYSAPYLPANFSKSAFGAETGYDLTRTLRVYVGYDYQHKTFNDVFSFRDLNLNGFGANAVWKALSRLKVWSFFDYEFARTKAFDLPDTSTVPDYSYNAWDITLGVRHYTALWPKLRPELVGTFQFRRIEYQTNKLPDIHGHNIYQFGRGDNNYQVRLGTAWRVLYRMRLEVDYVFLMKRSSLPDIYPNPYLNITQTTSELEKKLNYSANVVSLRISRQF